MKYNELSLKELTFLLIEHQGVGRGIDKDAVFWSLERVGCHKDGDVLERHIQRLQSIDDNDAVIHDEELRSWYLRRGLFGDNKFCEKYKYAVIDTARDIFEQCTGLLLRYNSRELDEIVEWLELRITYFWHDSKVDDNRIQKYEEAVRDIAIRSLSIYDAYIENNRDYKILYKEKR